MINLSVIDKLTSMLYWYQGLSLRYIDGIKVGMSMELINYHSMTMLVQTSSTAFGWTTQQQSQGAITTMTTQCFYPPPDLKIYQAWKY